MKAGDYQATHFLWSCEDRVGTLTLNRPEKKNPLTFESYAELRDLFRALIHAEDCKAVVINGAGENFCSGGDVHEIIGPLTRMDMDGLLRFTRMTGDLVRAMRGCPQPVIAAVDGVCAGAGAIMAMVSDLRLATPRAKTAFLFSRVGLAGCDMGACAILPRIIGHGRARRSCVHWPRDERGGGGALGRSTTASLRPEGVAGRGRGALARGLADGPSFAHAMTRTARRRVGHEPGDRSKPRRRRRRCCMRPMTSARATRPSPPKRTPEFRGD